MTIYGIADSRHSTRIIFLVLFRFIPLIFRKCAEVQTAIPSTDFPGPFRRGNPLIFLSFHGAAGTVTGSKYLLSSEKTNLLIDCGIFQGRRELRTLNWEAPPFKPSDIDAVVITHAHIDHIGYIPRLVKQGFRGKIYSSAPTASLAAISLLDTAHLQMEDAEYRGRKKISRHKKVLPLFDDKDTERALKHLVPVDFGDTVAVADDVSFRFQPAGHILGAAGIEVKIAGSDERTVFFSGDVGRYGSPLAIDPSPPPSFDYLVCESTYGGRLHEPESPYSILADIINAAVEKKSVILIPAFAVSRTQQLIYILNDLIRHDRIPPIDIHIDSPMAISVTDIYCKYHSLHRIDSRDLLGEECILEGKNIFRHRDQNESKALNKLKGPAVIMSASGMMAGGRIMHHLINRLPDPSTTLVVTGYQAEGTIGRRILEGEKEVFIHKRPVKINAKVKTIQGLSAHADYFELLHWLETVESRPRMVYITHGEPSQSAALADHFKKEKKWECHIPSLNEKVQL